MSVAERLPKRARGVARRALEGSLPEDLVAELIENQLEAEPHLRPWYEAMDDDAARNHFGEDEVLEHEHLRRGIRYFHAWRVHTLRERIDGALAGSSMLDVGDTDGLMLKHLDQSGIGFNIAPAAIRNIESNGIEAVFGDAHGMPFDDASFDFVLCFETLEHAENPHQLLTELARVCKPGGRVFVSIPWVPQTTVHPRDPEIDRGYGHVFELSRRDFGALVTHTPLEIGWETTCDTVGEPTRLAQRTYLRLTRNDHILAGAFRRFQFFELCKRA